MTSLCCYLAQPLSWTALERAPEALTVDAVVDAAGVAKGTFYYHFQSIEELATAVGENLLESLDDLLAPARLGMPDPIARMSFAFTEFVEKAIADPLWAQLVVRLWSAGSPRLRPSVSGASWTPSETPWSSD